MFARIASRYDLLNHLLSAGLDRTWRRLAAREIAPLDGLTLLDLCAGTGDMAAEVLRRTHPDLLVGCDFARPMLSLAHRKLRRSGLATACRLVEADGLRLPFADATFDGVTVAFGVRNLADMDAGLREILRVLKPGGRLVLLEFSRPTGPVVAPLYRIYLTRILPWIGDLVVRRSGPYRYLAASISEFSEPAALAGRIREAGFAVCGWRCLTAGIVAIHIAFKSD
jgi:demethylmenaquinone methyltransferase/2-methoxy-6-polyprenyl-1,4-benzoquinol methylase